MVLSGSSSAVYIGFNFKDHTTQAVLHSGCEVCLHMCKNAKTITVKTELLAANGPCIL